MILYWNWDYLNAEYDHNEIMLSKWYNINDVINYIDADMIICEAYCYSNSALLYHFYYIIRVTMSS